MHEARSIMKVNVWIASAIILAVILIANIGGIWLASTF